MNHGHRRGAAPVGGAGGNGHGLKMQGTVVSWKLNPSGKYYGFIKPEENEFTKENVYTKEQFLKGERNLDVGDTVEFTFITFMNKDRQQCSAKNVIKVRRYQQHTLASSSHLASLVALASSMHFLQHM